MPLPLLPALLTSAIPRFLSSTRCQQSSSASRIVSEKSCVVEKEKKAIVYEIRQQDSFPSYPPYPHTASPPTTVYRSQPLPSPAFSRPINASQR
jgi:hypothetical protein